MRNREGWTVLAAAVLAVAAASCGRGQAGPRPFDPSVSEPPAPEVVMNLPDPYVLQGEPSFLRLERRFSIDGGAPELEARGLAGIQAFDVDARGRVYVIQWDAGRDHIFQFDNRGRFLRSFCRTGRETGEIEFGGAVLAHPEGGVLAKDPSKSEVLAFDRDGRFLRRIPVPRLLDVQAVFANGYSLITWQDQTPDRYINHVAVARRTFEVRRHLDSAEFINEWNAAEIVVGRYAFVWGAAGERIYVGNAERGYEIRVFDVEGNLVRVIRRQPRPVPITEDARKLYLDRIPDASPFKWKYRFEDAWPPFRALFPDDEGRLFVMTYEPGRNPDERMFDIFDRSGLFTGRLALSGLDENCPCPVRARNGVLYVLRAGTGRARVLSAYDMVWE